MFVTTFSIAGHYYAIDNTSIIRILPRVEFHPIPCTPAYVLGLFEYKSSLIPAIDVSYLLYEKPAKIKLGNRILLTDYIFSNSHRSIGLLVESDVRLIDVDKSLIEPSPIKTSNAQFLGSIIKQQNTFIQIITIQDILTPTLVQQFFNPC